MMSNFAIAPEARDIPDVTYNMVMDVTESWSALKRIPNCERIAGEMIYMKLLEIDPSVGEILKIDMSSPAFRTSARFAFLARNVFDMIDCTVAFLGPDLDPLAEQLHELGKRHIAYGVGEDNLVNMGKAIAYVMKELLEEKYSACDAAAWATVYHFMVIHMAMGLKM